MNSNVEFYLGFKLGDNEGVVSVCRNRRCLHVRVPGNRTGAARTDLTFDWGPTGQELSVRTLAEALLGDLGVVDYSESQLMVIVERLHNLPRSNWSLQCDEVRTLCASGK